MKKREIISPLQKKVWESQAGTKIPSSELFLNEGDDIRESSFRSLHQHQLRATSLGELFSEIRYRGVLCMGSILDQKPE